MSFSDRITLIGTVVTLISMGVSIWQARSAFRSSQIAKRAMKAVKLAAVAERLKSAQEHIRDVAPDKVTQRGFKVGNRFDIIRREFDSALNALPKTGVGSEARKLLTNAQTELNSYQNSTLSSKDSTTWQRLQVFVQDAISDLTSTTSSIGEKYDK